MGHTVSATGQQVGQNDCWSLYQLCGETTVLWGLLESKREMQVQHGNRNGRLTIGHYSNDVVYRQYCGAY